MSVPMEPVTVTPASVHSIRQHPVGEDGVGALANDLRLVCAPRKVSSGRLSHLLELAFRGLRASRAGIAVLTADGELLEHLTCGTTQQEAAEAARSPNFLRLLRTTVVQAGPVRIERANFVPDGPEGGTIPGPFLGVPLSGARRSRGVLYLLRDAGDAEFTSEDEELLVPLAGWMEQANLSEEARLLNRLRVLNQIAQAAAGNVDLESILAVTLRELDRLLPLHICSVWLVEEESPHHPKDGEPLHGEGAGAVPPRQPSLLLAASSADLKLGLELGLRPGLLLEPEEAVCGACVHDGRAFYGDFETLASDGSRPAARRARTLSEGGAKTCFAVPLRAGERIVGVLQSICTRPGGFTGEQFQLLYLVADLLGPAISNCQLFRHLSAAYDDLRIAQSQLIQAEKMRALGELAGGVAHEFNNALCGVLGFLELSLLNKGLDPSCRNFLEAARTCATDAAQTVRRVQDFARWRRNELTCQVVNLDDFVRQTVELIRHKWENFDAQRTGPIRVEVEAEGPAIVSANPVELREVLTNLAFNAVDAMPRGGTLTIRAWKTEADGFLSVRDTGIGIPQAVRHRLFEPFFTTKGERGNGLGLSVAFGIVRRHAGEITVDSEEGKGALFTVRLPLASSPRAPARPAHGHGLLARSEIARPAAGRGLRILVVEDEESVRRFLDTALSRLGHRPRLACDVEEGTAALKEESFDVVLTDLGLPRISGEEFARRVAVHSPCTPVVLLTGWADQLQAEQRSFEGVSRILSKPVTLDVLAATLASLAN